MRGMPTVRRIGSVRFFFYSNEGSEPPHIHVEQGDALAKFWLDPVSLASSSRYRAHELRLSAWSRSTRPSSKGHGVSTSPDVDPRAVDVSVDADDLTVVLADGRRVSVPLAWYPRLLHATPSSAPTGASSAMARASTGPTSTRI